jgi:hypothetical protein
MEYRQLPASGPDVSKNTILVVDEDALLVERIVQVRGTGGLVCDCAASLGCMVES